MDFRQRHQPGLCVAERAFDFDACQSHLKAAEQLIQLAHTGDRGVAQRPHRSGGKAAYRRFFAPCDGFDGPGAADFDAAIEVLKAHDLDLFAVGGQLDDPAALGVQIPE